jgi:polo-like kinase 4
MYSVSSPLTPHIPRRASSVPKGPHFFDRPKLIERPQSTGFAQPPRTFSACDRKQKLAYTIDDFVLGEHIGSGAFGDVYRAFSKVASLPHNVAIKKLSKSRLGRDTDRKRVTSEIYIHSRLNHPSILRLYTSFEDKQHVYLVMELCENGPLFDYIHQGRNAHRVLSEPETRFVMLQVIQGMLYLSKLGIMHRDLKLGNLLLTRENNVKIADFGLAAMFPKNSHAKYSSKTESRAREQQTLCGTPNYIAPEIVVRKPYSQEVDVWSLGCLAVVLLTGVPPFESPMGDVTGTLNRVLSGNYKLPSGAQISDEGRSLIAGLLQLEPSQRLPLTSILRHEFFSPDLAVHRLPIIGYEPVQNSWNDNQSSRRGSILLGNNPKDSTLSTLQSHHLIADKSSCLQYKNEPIVSLATSLGIKPFSQSTKIAHLQLLHCGSLSLIFQGEDGIFTISQSGRDVYVFPGRSLKHLPVSECSGQIDFTRAVATYKYEALPSAMVKKYHYASKVLDVIRSKSPAVILYTSTSKASLMLSKRHCNIHFKNGVKIFYVNNGLEGLIHVKAPEVLTFPISTAPPTYQVYVNHVLHCFRECCEIYDAERPRAKDYPIVVKSASYLAERVCNDGKSSPECFDTNGTYRTNEHGIQRNSELPRYIPDGVKRYSSAVGRDSACGRSVSSGGAYPYSTSHKISPSIRSSDHEPPSKASPHCPSSLTNAVLVFLPGVGWCTRSNLGIYTLYFQDGCILTVDAKTHVLEFGKYTPDKQGQHSTTPSRIYPQKYAINGLLPDTIKRKLMVFKKSIEEFKLCA